MEQWHSVRKSVINHTKILKYFSIILGCDGRRSHLLKRASYEERIKLYEIVNQIDFDVATKNETNAAIASLDEFYLVSKVLTNGFAEFSIKSEEKTYGVVDLLIGKNFGVSKIRNIFMKSIFCGQIFFLR